MKQDKWVLDLADRTRDTDQRVVVVQVKSFIKLIK